jgi:nitrile hydratase subunit beta
MSEPRFAVGSRVRAVAVDPDHHTRVPRYARGQVGEVVDVQGTWPLADDRARGFAEPRVEPVYTVRFPAGALWGQPSGHWVQVALWESYLEVVT